MPSHQAASDRPRIGLVLGSGGARGAAHIGVLKVLEELEIPIDIICGASMGAIIGGAYAAGVTLEALEKEWTKTNFIKLAKHLLPSHSFKYWTAGKELYELFTKYVGHMLIEDLEIPFAAVSTDIYTGEVFVFRSGRLADAMRASSSIPILFAPIESDDHCLIDGGLVNPLPIDIAREMGAQRVIAVDVNSRPKGLLDPRKHSESEEAKEHGTPDLVETVSAIMILVQRQLAKHHLQHFPADIYLEPNAYADILGYRHGKEIIASGERAARNHEAEFKALLEP